MRLKDTLDEIGTAVGNLSNAAKGTQGTAQGLLTKLTPDELRGPLVREQSKSAAMEELQSWPR